LEHQVGQLWVQGHDKVFTDQVCSEDRTVPEIISYCLFKFITCNTVWGNYYLLFLRFAEANTLCFLLTYVMHATCKWI
jgi:hypothetical protein